MSTLLASRSSGEGRQLMHDHQQKDSKIITFYKGYRKDYSNVNQFNFGSCPSHWRTQLYRYLEPSALSQLRSKLHLFVKGNTQLELITCSFNFLFTSYVEHSPGTFMDRSQVLSCGGKYASKRITRALIDTI